jgi:hypothetical protein
MKLDGYNLSHNNKLLGIVDIILSALSLPNYTWKVDEWWWWNVFS